MLAISCQLNEDVLTARGHNSLMRRLNHYLMNRVKLVYWPKHFEHRRETAPGGAYGYAPRSSGYIRRKLRKVGHSLPNVYSGTMRREVQQNAQVTSTSTRGVLRSRFVFKSVKERNARLTGRQWRIKRNRDAQRGPSRQAESYAQRRQEMEAIAPQESKDTVKLLGKMYAAWASQHPEYRRKRRRRRR